MTGEEKQQPIERLAERISKNISLIRDVVGKCSTESVVRRCMDKHHEGYFSKADLSSPAKQISFLLGAPVVQLDIDPAELGRSYPIQAGLQGDARASLRKLIEAMEPLGPRSEWVARAQELVRDWRESVAPQVNSDASPIRPERLCKEITEWMPSDAVLVTDTGHSGIWTGTMVDSKNPEQMFLRCAGSLGWAFPAAMGGQVRRAGPPGDVLHR